MKKITTKAAAQLTDKELEQEIAKLEKHVSKIKASPLLENPEAFLELWNGWKKDKKIDKKKRLLKFMILDLKAPLCSVFANYRERMIEVLKKNGVDAETSGKIMLSLPTSYSYGSAFTIEMYDIVKKLVATEIRESKKLTK